LEDLEQMLLNRIGGAPKRQMGRRGLNKEIKKALAGTRPARG
jgi:hypothetical protein